MPAAAVIPAPIAYIKVVAVKKLVVGSRDPGEWSASRRFTVRWRRLGWPLRGFVSVGVVPGLSPSGLPVGALDCSAGGRTSDVYFEKIRVFQAGAVPPEYMVHGIIE